MAEESRYFVYARNSLDNLLLRVAFASAYHYLS